MIVDHRKIKANTVLRDESKEFNKVKDKADGFQCWIRE